MDRHQFALGLLYELKPAPVRFQNLEEDRQDNVADR